MSAAVRLQNAKRAISSVEQEAALDVPDHVYEQREWVMRMRYALDMAAEQIELAAQAEADVSTQREALMRLEQLFADSRRRCLPREWYQESEDDIDRLDELDLEDKATEAIEEDELNEDDGFEPASRVAINVPMVSSSSKSKPGGGRRKRVVVSQVLVPQGPRSTTTRLPDVPIALGMNSRFVVHNQKCERCTASAKTCIGVAGRACIACKASKSRCSLARGLRRTVGEIATEELLESSTLTASPSPVLGSPTDRPVTSCPQPLTEEQRPTLRSKAVPKQTSHPGPSLDSLSTHPVPIHEPDPTHPTHPTCPPHAQHASLRPAPLIPAREKRPRERSPPAHACPAPAPQAHEAGSSTVSGKRARIDHELGLRARPSSFPVPARTRPMNTPQADPLPADGVCPAPNPRLARGKDRERQRDKEKEEGNAKGTGLDKTPKTESTMVPVASEPATSDHGAGSSTAPGPVPSAVTTSTSDPGAISAFGSISNTASALANVAAGLTARNVRMDDGALLRLVTPLLQMQAAMATLSAELVRLIEQNAGKQK